MNNIYSNPSLRDGLFFNPENFRMDLYIIKWGELMLSNKAIVTTFKDLCAQNRPEEELIFIRPLDDSKLFNGQVKTFLEIKNWQKNIQVIKDNALTENTPILAGEPYKINKEWRNIIVEGRVVSSSRYYNGGYLSKSATDIPEEVIELCEKACKIFTPHDVFAMDIAETGGEYYIIECGCFNSVGFYDMDIEKVVLAVHKYFKDRYEKRFSLFEMKQAYLNGWYDSEIVLRFSKEKHKSEEHLKLYIDQFKGDGLIIQGEKDPFNYDDGKKLNPIYNIQCKYCEKFFDSLEDLSLHQEYDCNEE